MDPDTTRDPGPRTDPAGGAAPRAWPALYQEAFEFAPDCQLVTDGYGIVLEANHAAAALIGHRKEFLIGKPLALFAVAGSRAYFYQCLGRFNRGIETHVFEAQLTRRGDRPREVYAVARLGEHSSAPNARPTIHWLIRDVTESRHAEEARADLQRRLTTAQEDERRRVARDLHDTSGQLITALALGVRAVRDAGPLPEAARDRLDHVQCLVDDLARQVHDLAARLRPTALDDLGLEAAVRHLIVTWSERTRVGADFQFLGPTDQRFPSEVETVLFRVVQEALTNVAKHAAASRVAVVLGHRDGHAVAVIEDDGIGFDTEGVSQAPYLIQGDRAPLGLLGMRERVGLLRGTLEVETAPAQGTTIIVRLPLDAPSVR